MQNIIGARAQKIVALLICIPFTSSSISYSAPAIQTSSFSGTADRIAIPHLFDKLEIPESIGKVREVRVAERDAPGAMRFASSIIHIQDAHAHLEAQRNIEKLLDYLVREKGIETIFLEGTAGKLNADMLRYFKDEARNQKLNELFFARRPYRRHRIFSLKTYGHASKFQSRGVRR